MMTVANITGHIMRAANGKIKKAREWSGNWYGYPVNVNHAIGVYQDRLIGEVIAERGG